MKEEIKITQAHKGQHKYDCQRSWYGVKKAFLNKREVKFFVIKSGHPFDEFYVRLMHAPRKEGELRLIVYTT